VIGPAIAAVGFALFAWPDGQAGSYWTTFFPAVMVMSLGMATSVAPLTTTVMSAVDERRVGVASGVNNAVSRAAGLLAVAAFGAIALTVFERGLAARLQSLPLSAELRAELLAETRDFVGPPLPADASAETRAAVAEAVRDSFVAGFRVVAWLAAGLALLSAAAAWWLIGGTELRA
jgi:hypothetical protein